MGSFPKRSSERNYQRNGEKQRENGVIEVKQGKYFEKKYVYYDK